MYERTYGGNYDNELSTTDIAKKIRSWVTAQKKSGAFPKELKVSVRSKYFSGGSSIDVSITALPEDWDLFNREWFEYNASNDYAPRDVRKYTDKVERIRAEIKAYVNSFNHDGSESQVDYFDVNFYFCDVEMDWRKYYEVEKAYRESIKDQVVNS